MRQQNITESDLKTFIETHETFFDLHYLDASSGRLMSKRPDANLFLTSESLIGYGPSAPPDPSNTTFEIWGRTDSATNQAQVGWYYRYTAGNGTQQWAQFISRTGGTPSTTLGTGANLPDPNATTLQLFWRQGLLPPDEKKNGMYVRRQTTTPNVFTWVQSSTGIA